MLWVLVLLLVSLPALAQEQPDTPKDVKLVEQVDVTGNLAKERQDPATFTTLDRQQLLDIDRGQDMAVLLTETPNSFAYSDAGNGVGYSYFFLRGFDQRRIAVNINGIPLNTPETHQVYFIDLADFAGALDTAQVQRGTGTALYGSPAVGGVVNLVTRHLSLEPQGQLRLGGGSFGTYRAALEYGGRIGTSDWAWIARASHVQSDGYRDNAWTRHTLGFLGVERFGATSTLRINLYGGPEDTQLSYYGVPKEYLDGQVTGNADNDRRVNFLRPGETDHFFQPHLEILHDWRIDERWTLHNALYATIGSGYYNQYDDARDVVTAYDPSTGYPVSTVTVENAWRKRQIDERQIGWIPRAQLEQSFGELLFGLEVRLHHAHHRGWITDGTVEGEPVSGSPRLYDYVNTKQSFTAFARESLRLSKALTLNLELGGTSHSFAMKDDALRGLSFEGHYDWLTPRVGVNWNADEHVNVYASASSAASEPTFRDIWDAQDPFVRPGERFDSASGLHYSDPRSTYEKLRAFELGAGYTGARGKVKASVYRLEFRDELVFAGGLDDDGNPITTNAGKSRHEGVELEFAARLPWELDLGGFVSFSNDRLLDLRVPASNEAGEVDYSGNRIALFPDHLVRLSLARRFGPVRVALGARRVGTIYTDNSENERKDPALRSQPGWVDKQVDPYTLADLKVFVETGSPYRFEFAVENLFDRKVAVFGYSYPDAAYQSFYTEFFPNATRSVFFGLTRSF